MKPDSTAFIIQLELTPRINLELRTEQQATGAACAGSTITDPSVAACAV